MTTIYMEQMQCENYQNIFSNGAPDKNNVLDDYAKNCHTHSINIQYKKVDHPFKSDNKCYLLTKNNDIDKTKKYYVHTYDTTKLFSKIRAFLNMDDKFKTDYIEKIEQIANVDKVSDCCNCVAFVLYKTFDVSDDLYETVRKIASYLYSLFISTNNITKYLDTFISRIYLDMSVFHTINKLNEMITNNHNIMDESSMSYVKAFMTHITQIINYFFDTDNIEVYTYLCPDFDKDFAKLRSLRFMILTDEKVNIKIIREADGYVTCIDCMNIKNMIVENNAFMIYDLNDKMKTNVLSYNDDIKSNEHIYSIPYSIWLSLRMLYDDFFDNNLRLFDIYAGLFGTSLQIKKKSYNDAVQKINNFIDQIETIEKDKLLIDYAYNKFVEIWNQLYDLMNKSGIDIANTIRELGNGIYDPESLYDIYVQLSDDDIKFENDIDEYINKFIYILNNAQIADLIKKIKENKLSNNKFLEDKNIKTVTYYLKIGFDEMVLLELFKHIITIPTREIDHETIQKYKNNRKSFNNFYDNCRNIIYSVHTPSFFFNDMIHYNIDKQYKNKVEIIDFFKNIVSYENVVIELNGYKINDIFESLHIFIKEKTTMNITIEKMESYLRSTVKQFELFPNKTTLILIAIDSLFKQNQSIYNGCLKIICDDETAFNSTSSLLNFTIYDFCNPLNNNQTVNIRDTIPYIIYN